MMHEGRRGSWSNRCKIYSRSEMYRGTQPYVPELTNNEEVSGWTMDPWQSETELEKSWEGLASRVGELTRTMESHFIRTRCADQ